MKRKNNMIERQGFITLVCIVKTLSLIAQENNEVTNNKPQINNKSPFLEVNKEQLFKPVVALESWATYSIGEEKNGSEYADRGDLSFRRFRFGGKGSPYTWLSYSFQLHLDRLGEDSYASTKGSYGGIDIWNAFITARLLKSDLLNLHAGYYWAAISREFNTSAWAVGSFDKTRADWYMRNFITGKGNGIESGIGLGGLKNFENFGISYRLGTYEPDAFTSSEYGSRLYTGRIMFSIGDAEQEKYGYMLSGNQWMKRTGITLGLGASTQSDGKLSDTLYFDNSMAYGTDLLINYKGLRMDGEYFIFKRTAQSYSDFDGTEWHVRAGYSFMIGTTYLEPAVTYESYEGEGSKALYKYIGDDNTWDIGLNWYINKEKLKLATHYIIQDGSTSPNTGDYIGFAFQYKL